MTQASNLRAPFPPSVLSEVRGMTYVPVGEVVARLNNVLDDFSIDSTDISMPLPGEIIAVVTISATIDGHHRTSVGVGGDQATTKRDSDDLVDLGNNGKTAASEALKKAAQAWGVGLHLARGDDREALDVAVRDGWHNVSERIDAVTAIRAECQTPEQSDLVRDMVFAANETTGTLTRATEKKILAALTSQQAAT